MIGTEVGAAVSFRREFLGMTQLELSLASGVTPSHLHSIVKGRVSPTLMTLERIARALNSDVYGLLRTAYRIKKQ